MVKQSFVERLRFTRETTKPLDPWAAILANIRGQVGHDGLERISTDAVLEKIGVPPFKRTPDAQKRLKLLMIDMNWVPVRSRHVTSRGRAGRVRGYARIKQPVRQQSTVDNTIKPSNR